MKLITVNEKGSFCGATLPLGRTNAGQYYIKALTGQGPAVAIDLLLSQDARILASENFQHAELILNQASIYRDAKGGVQLAPQVSTTPKQSEEDAVLLWIPGLRESVEVNLPRVCGGTSLVIEDVRGSCERLCTGGLVRLTAPGSFVLATYPNLSDNRKDLLMLSSTRVQFHGRNEVYVAGEMPNRYSLKWA